MVFDAVQVLQRGLQDVPVLGRGQLAVHLLSCLAVRDEVRVLLVPATLLTLQVLVNVMQNKVFLLQTELFFSEILRKADLEPQIQVQRAVQLADGFEVGEPARGLCGDVNIERDRPARGVVGAIHQQRFQFFVRLTDRRVSQHVSGETVENECFERCWKGFLKYAHLSLIVSGTPSNNLAILSISLP